MAASTSTIKERAPSLPNYRDSLNVEHVKIYDEKLNFTADIDPYAVSGRFYSTAMENYPEIEFPDMVNYLLFTKSRFTKEQLKAYGSLEAYQYFVAGWVRSIHVGNVTVKTVVLIGKVGGRYLRVWTRVRVKLRVKFRVVIFFSFCNAFLWGFFCWNRRRTHGDSCSHCPNSRGTAQEQEPVVLCTRIALQDTRVLLIYEFTLRIVFLSNLSQILTSCSNMYNKMS